MRSKSLQRLPKHTLRSKPWCPESLEETDIVGRFAWNLRAMRVGRGVSQEVLAHGAGINRTYVSRLERRQENPTIIVVDRLATALGCPINDLFSYPASRSAPPQLLRGGRKTSK